MFKTMQETTLTVRQGYAVIAFTREEPNRLSPYPDEWSPFVTWICDDKNVAIKVAKTMRKLAWEEDGKDCHFIVQSVPIQGPCRIVSEHGDCKGLCEDVTIV